MEAPEILKPGSPLMAHAQNHSGCEVVCNDSELTFQIQPLNRSYDVREFFALNYANYFLGGIRRRFMKRFKAGKKHPSRNN